MGNVQGGNEAAAVWVSTKSLKPWVKNPRKNDHAVQKVADSIKRFGFGSPILARKADGEIIAGHTRLKAALSLGIDKVPVRYLDLDQADAHLLALADNKLGELADWDDAMVAEVLAGYDAGECALAGFAEDQPLPDVPECDALGLGDLAGESEMMVFRMVVPKSRKEDVERAIAALGGDAPSGQGEKIGFLFLRLACSS